MYYLFHIPSAKSDVWNMVLEIARIFVKLSNILNFSSNEDGSKLASLPEKPANQQGRTLWCPWRCATQIPLREPPVQEVIDSSDATC